MSIFIIIMYFTDLSFTIRSENALQLLHNALSQYRFNETYK